MSLIVKGMEMPSKCRFCPCCVDNGLIGMQREYFCSALDSALGIDNLEQKLSACPFVEISTPHGRLIDADRLKHMMEQYHCNGCDNYNGTRCSACWIADCFRYIDDIPTIIEAENKSEGINSEVPE